MAFPKCKKLCACLHVQSFVNITKLVLKTVLENLMLQSLVESPQTMYVVFRLKSQFLQTSRRSVSTFFKKKNDNPEEEERNSNKEELAVGIRLQNDNAKFWNWIFRQT